jgi:hypothetical protein
MPSESKTFTVVRILGEGTRVAINGGAHDGITSKDRFVVFELGEDVIDPQNKENLGPLEIVKGSAKPIHIQDRITTLESDQRRTGPRTKIVKRGGGNSIFGFAIPEIEETIEPDESVPQAFIDIKEGDSVKMVKRIS